MHKKQLRKQIREKRNAIPRSEWDALCDALQQVCMQSKMFRQAKHIFCYVSRLGEVRTDLILQTAWQMGKQVSVPRCQSEGQMQTYRICSREDLQVGAYGILEPKEDCPPSCFEQFDLICVPCLAADYQGYRLGYGGGYYDRYLQGAQQLQCFTLCPSQFLLHTIFPEVFDIPMGGIITEKGVFRVAAE